LVFQPNSGMLTPVLGGLPPEKKKIKVSPTKTPPFTLFVKKKRTPGDPLFKTTPQKKGPGHQEGGMEEEVMGGHQPKKWFWENWANVPFGPRCWNPPPSEKNTKGGGKVRRGRVLKRLNWLGGPI